VCARAAIDAIEIAPNFKGTRFGDLLCLPDGGVIANMDYF
jgi:hypothetical protein